jgi:LEA14-like dessication related protein
MKSAALGRLLGALLLGGCTPLGLWLYEDPEVTVSRITVETGGPRASRTPVVVALALRNMNDYPVSTERVELALHLDGITIGQLKRDSSVRVATDTVSTVAVPLPVAKRATRERLRSLTSGTHTFAVRGRATFRTPIGRRKVRFAQEGSLVFGAPAPGGSAESP